LKWCREIVAPLRRRGFLAAFLLAILLAISGGVFAARGAMPAWIQNIEARAAAEAALFRAMLLPGGEVMARRPPRESRPLLGELIKAQPAAAELYSLRALEDEQQLDFSAAEADWKSYVEHSPDRIRAELALADFYHRRLRPKDEIAALSVVANAALPASEKLTPTAEQSSWLASERIFQVIQAQALPAEVSSAQYRAWIVRYPKEAALYTRYFEFLVAAKD
jgi:hypothetical protein